MPKKLNKIAKELNVSLPTIIDFLRKKNITVDENPNTRIEDNVVDMLTAAFASDKDLKNRSEQIATERKETRQQRPEPKAAPASAEEPKLTTVQKPRILGKINLDAKGNPVAPKPAAVEVKKPETPAPAPAKPVEPKPKHPNQHQWQRKSPKPPSPQPW